MSLQKYEQKRSFEQTPEPRGNGKPTAKGQRFVVQKHAASRLHYDFRLELDGVLKSWAVPKGPSLDPAEKRLAVHVEDHPLDYIDFEGVIPQGQYGGGTVIVWDAGAWEADEDLSAAYAQGKLKFRLKGEKLSGGWALVKMRGKRHRGEDNWLLIKEQDDAARPDSTDAILTEAPASVQTGRTIDEVEAGVSPKNGGKNGKPKSTRKETQQKRQRKTRSKSAVIPEIKPQLARISAKGAPTGEQWLHEIKFDGYRILAEVQDNQALLWTRSRQDWTSKFPWQAAAIEELPVDSAVFDGEIVAFDKSGVSQFQKLQTSFREQSTKQLVYQVFDLLWLNGRDLRRQPLEERKQELKRLLQQNSSSRLQYCDHIDGNGPDFFDESCKLGLEGIISKRRNHPYRSGRGGDWLKTKCLNREEFVIGGYTHPQGSRQGLGALLVGRFNEAGKLVYAGRVGTGFSNETLQDLAVRLGRLERKTPPFEQVPARESEAVWTTPRLVAQLEFTSWTRDGRLRHPAFLGLREDLPAENIHVEAAASAPQGKGSSKMTGEQQVVAASPVPLDEYDIADDQLRLLADVRLTSPDKVLYPESGMTKLELVRYYALVSQRILPELAERPVSLVRCPSGVGKKCFYQKHAVAGTPDEIDTVRIREKEGADDYLVVNHLPALAATVQMGVLELHPWGARTDRLERPDRLIFDLDPDETVDWQQIVAAAYELKERLDGLGLQSFVKTTGGKGLHIIVPLTRRQDWDEAKGFSETLAKRMARESPQRYTAVMSKKSRVGKIYIDYQRNGRGATAVAAYSMRARTGAPVATPVSWDELQSLTAANQFKPADAVFRVVNQPDPWAEMADVHQSLTKAVWSKLKG